MKVDFRKISVEDLDGNANVVDVSKVFGNVIFRNTGDIAEYELAKKIYHEGEVELTGDEARSIAKYADAFDKVIVRETVKNVLLKTEK